MTDQVRDWELERYLLGELPAAEAEAVRAALERDEGLRARLQALERSNAEILDQHPARTMAAAIAARPRRDDPPVRPLPRLALAAAGAAAVLVGLVVLVPWPPGGAGEERAADESALDPSRDVTRVKGMAPRLTLYRKGPGGAEALPSGSAARHRDVVQLSYHAAGRRYGAIVSIDGRGVVTRHLPATGPTAALLETGSVVLPQAYELDDAPGFERFYLVTADEPFAMDMVVAAVQRRQITSPAPSPDSDARLDLPAAWDQSSLVLKKE